jgi:hypothetical protein
VVQCRMKCRKHNEAETGSDSTAGWMLHSPKRVPKPAANANLNNVSRLMTQIGLLGLEKFPFTAQASRLVES